MFQIILRLLCAIYQIKLCKVWPFSDFLLTSLSGEILCASVETGLSWAVERKHAGGRVEKWSLGAEGGPGPSRLHLVASCCLEWFRVIRQAPVIKQGAQQQLGRVTFGYHGRQAVPRNSALWGHGARCEGWMRDGVTKGFLEREQLNSKPNERPCLYIGKVLLKCLRSP